MESETASIKKFLGLPLNLSNSIFERIIGDMYLEKRVSYLLVQKKVNQRFYHRDLEENL